MSEGAEIVAAGVVVSRKGPEVLLVHRPKYDDWSFPKGKLDPDEHVTTAAVREVAEETGLDVRLGPPLPSQRYSVRNGETRVKRVHYWAGRVVGGDDVSSYKPNDEIDEVAWVKLDKAPDRLTYARDRETLEEAVAFRKKSNPLVVLRHGKATSRKAWRARRPRPAAQPHRDDAGRAGRPDPRRVRRPAGARARAAAAAGARSGRSRTSPTSTSR